MAEMMMMPVALLSFSSRKILSIRRPNDFGAVRVFRFSDMVSFSGMTGSEEKDLYEHEGEYGANDGNHQFLVQRSRVLCHLFSLTVWQNRQNNRGFEAAVRSGGTPGHKNGITSRYW